MAFVPEMLRHRHGRVGRFPPQQRGRIGGGRHDHRAGQAVRAQLVLQELAHLAATLADESEHRHVAGGVARQHGKQRRLADAGAGEQPKPLPGAAGGEQVERRDAEVHPLAKPRPGRRLGRGGPHRAGLVTGRQGAASVERLAQRVDHPPEPALAGRERRPRAPAGRGRGRTHDAADADTVQRAERHRADRAGTEPEDLGGDLGAAAGFHPQAFPDAGEGAQAGDIERQACDRAHASADLRRTAGGERGGCERQTLGQGSLSHTGYFSSNCADLARVATLSLTGR